MTKHAWVKELPIIITVSDAEGDIIEMNDSSIKYFEDDGSDLLIGSDLLACHPEPYRTKLKTTIDTQTTNIYGFEEDGKYAGFIEMIMEIPDEIPHHAD